MGKKSNRKYRHIIGCLLISFFFTAIVNSAASAEDSYTYDPLNRLKTVVLENEDTIIYEYDDLGNILSIAYNQIAVMIVKKNETDISPGELFSFGDVPTVTSETVIFTIENLGDQNLVLNGSPNLVAINPPTYFSVFQQPSLTIIPPGGQTAFEIEFSPDLQSTTIAQISILNNSSENPYTFNVDGRGVIALCVNGNVYNGQTDNQLNQYSIVSPCESAYTIHSGGSATFQARKAIILKPGFWAKEGSSFHSYIQP